MAARPHASPRVGRSRPLVLALGAVVAAASLAAACGGAPQATAPTVTAVSEGSTPAPDDAASTPVEVDGQARDDGAAGVEGEGSAGEGSAGDGASAGETTGDTSGTDGNGSVEGGSEGTAPENGSVADGSAEGTAPDSGAADGAAPERVVPERGPVDLVPAAAYLEFDQFVIGPFAPLTGSITTDPSLEQRRPLAVKIGNGDPKDRPQAGLAAADIVYEVLVEAAKTRFLAVFHSEVPTRIGPVRSVRSSDFDILEDLATPYLASSGANSTVRQEMRDAARGGTLIDVGALRMAAPYSRDRSRPAPHNMYFSYENLGGGDPESLPGGIPDAPPTALFEHGSPNPPGLPGAAGVTVAYRALYGTEVSHVWDGILGGWVRIQRGTLHTTETGSGVAEIAPANVVVVSMPYGRSAADRRSPQALSYGSGEALVLTAGAVHEAQWERTEDRVGFRFTDKVGNPLRLSAGSTWLLLANDSRRWPMAETAVLTASEGARLLAEARTAAAAEASTAAGS